MKVKINSKFIFVANISLQLGMFSKILQNKTTMDFFFLCVCVSVLEVRVDQTGLVSVRPVGEVRLVRTPVRTDHFPVAGRDASSLS